MISDADLATMIFLRLSYYQAISYANILAESSIRYPVAEYLERRLSYKKVILEYPNPVFQRKRCDLYVEKKYNTGKLEQIAFEFKYVWDNTSYLFQDYFDDILRLHYLHNEGMRAFFIVCGNPINFNNQFRSVKKQKVLTGSRNRRPSGIFSRVLSFSIDPLKIHKTLNTDKYKDYYKEFINHYEFKDTTVSHPHNLTFQTKLIKLIHGDDPHSVGIWEVL